ncbi:MAG: Gfo/Idh/MocA family oxidoreductase [Pirellulaceae bacterium]|jgi:predicted dehydrogenase|nr:Gfo/Idh/MocA family oxidoreductase [Pirellulaceae bacterium]
MTLPLASRRLASRRQFLTQSAAAASALALGAYVNPAAAQESKSPSERLRIAAVGTTGRAGGNLTDLSSQDIVALADVDAELLDKGAAKFPEARKYRDFRVMLEKEADKIDAVLVSPPDHTHAPAAAMAMRLGKHCYCEKPLTHTVFEARTLANLAKEKKLVTQMGNQIHAGDNYRRVVELLQAGAIGPVKEAHVWVTAQYTGAEFNTGTPTPKNLDWDLWLGPAVERPYSTGVHPFNWRKFWDYGTGALGDFGCHFLDLVHWGLDLRAPTAVSATGPKFDPVSCPEWCEATYEYPAREKMPAVTVHWYDSGRQPELARTLKIGDKPLGDVFKGAQLFVGSEGMLVSDYGRHVLLPEGKFADFKKPEPTIPRSIGHHAEWVQAIKTSGPTTCNFDYAGALTEAVLLGTVAYRSGERIEWNAQDLKIPNSPSAEALLHKEYRKGWTL